MIVKQRGTGISLAYSNLKKDQIIDYFKLKIFIQ